MAFWKNFNSYCELSFFNQKLLIITLSLNTILWFEIHSSISLSSNNFQRDRISCIWSRYLMKTTHYFFLHSKKIYINMSSIDLPIQNRSGDKKTDFHQSLTSCSHSGWKFILSSWKLSENCCILMCSWLIANKLLISVLIQWTKGEEGLLRGYIQLEDQKKPNFPEFILRNVLNLLI